MLAGEDHLIGTGVLPGRGVDLSRRVAVFTAWDGHKLIGVASAISDGVLYAYVPHLPVHSDYWGRGIGTELMRRLLVGTEDFEGIGLMTHSAKAQSFYESLGFEGAPDSLVAVGLGGSAGRATPRE